MVLGVIADYIVLMSLKFIVIIFITDICGLKEKEY